MKRAVQGRLTTIGAVVGVLAFAGAVVVLCDGPLWLGIVLTAALGVAVPVLIGATAAHRGGDR
jgi:hypothetical protein